MAWLVQPLEIADENGNPTGRFRMTATSDEGGGGPFGDTSHDHASAEEAQECVRCHEYCSRISGFPPRKERQISEPTEAQIEAAADALIDESNRGDWEYDEACRVAAAILRAALTAQEQPK